MISVSQRRSAGVLALMTAAVVAAAAIGGAATSRGVPEWYGALRKPPLTPPDAVFGPVWTALYCLMAAAAWRVWRQTGWRGGARPLALFGIQLALNALWSVVFFGLRRPDWALVELAMLWVAIALTIRAFARADRPAAWMLAPYLGWVTFAAYLNLGIAWLNR